MLLDEDPQLCAQLACDKHAVKMVTESSQLIATCFSLNKLKEAPKTQSGNYRKHFNPKHPSSIWARKSTGNLDWLLIFALYQLDEYKFRYNRDHFCNEFIYWAINNVDEAQVVCGELTEFSVAISQDSLCRQKITNFDDLCVVQKYQEYYNWDKAYFAKWEKGRSKPNFFRH
jgi:hypothetical protein